MEVPESQSSHNERVEPLHRNGKNHVPFEASFRLENSVINPPESFKPTDSPLVQVMERTQSPDSKNKSGRTDSPSRWSDDSNDSLFSIRMGNDSFSEDVSLRISGEMCTAGESSLSEAYLPRVSQKSPAAKGLNGAIKDANEVVDEANGDDACINTDTDSNLSGSIDPDASHHHSDDSEFRKEAFASALWNRACPLCKCLRCGKMECCCRRPKCTWFGWPSCPKNCLRLPNCCSCCSKSCCSNLICASCYSWKRDTKKARSGSANSLMEMSVTSSSKHKTKT